MASSGKRKTTMAKINRERKLQERRLDKAARKDARRNAPPAAAGDGYGYGPSLHDGELTDDLAPHGPSEADGTLPAWSETSASAAG